MVEFVAFATDEFDHFFWRKTSNILSNRHKVHAFPNSIIEWCKKCQILELKFFLKFFDKKIAQNLNFWLKVHDFNFL